MSSRRGPTLFRGRGRWLIPAVALCLPGVLAAQERGPDQAELIHKLDSLQAAYRIADSIADIADSIRLEERRLDRAISTDSVRIGPFVVIAPSEQAREARRDFERAWAPYAAFIGSESTSIHGIVFGYQSERPYKDIGVPRPRDLRIASQWLRGEGVYAAGQFIGGVLRHDLPEDVSVWLSDFYLREDSDRELEWTYRSLVTSRSVAVADCFEGILDRCWDAMGLRHRDGWWENWYDGAQRAWLVSIHFRSVRQDQDVLRAACLEGSDDDACVDLLGTTRPFIPLPTTARVSLLGHALTLGGAGAFHELSTGPEGSIEDRLARVAGVPAEELIASWREAVLAQRPDVREGSRQSRWTSLMWLLVLAGLSMRSTRWRLV